MKYFLNIIINYKRYNILGKNRFKSPQIVTKLPFNRLSVNAPIWAEDVHLCARPLVAQPHHFQRLLAAHIYGASLQPYGATSRP